MELSMEHTWIYEFMREIGGNLKKKKQKIHTWGHKEKMIFQNYAIIKL